MEIFSLIWDQYLYIPTFNLLVWTYSNHSFFNMGIAVIILTVGLRTLLLPFTILAEKGKIISEKLKIEINQIDKDYINDPVKRKEAIRKLLKKKKIRPWAKIIVLGSQLLVLFLLRRVFLGGIYTEEKRHMLYSQVSPPDFINTKFLWLDLSQKDLTITAITALCMFVFMMAGIWSSSDQPSKKERIYAVLLPIAFFLFLTLFPSVMSLFFLTSLIFSSIISIIIGLIKLGLKNKVKKA